MADILKCPCLLKNLCLDSAFLENNISCTV